jgi:hypothetical protein
MLQTALAPARKAAPGAPWAQLVAKAYELGIKLTVHSDTSGRDTEDLFYFCLSIKSEGEWDDSYPTRSDSDL